VTAVPGYTLVSRADCHLCEVMLEELRAFLGAGAPPIRVVDVDQDADLKRRFGHQVPVLLLDGEVVCHGRFDAAEAERLSRR
jgi:predicted thioredoxin/glutaredoxin